MNERLNNLRLDAGISQLKDDPRLVVIDRAGNVIDPLIGLEKFAQLIIQDACDMIIAGKPGYAHMPAEAALDLTAQNVRKYFGVE